MSTAKHIPGPWTVMDHYGVHVLTAGGLTIATVPHQIDYAGSEGRVQIQNARLIAAAPELLAALVGFVAEFGDKAVNANVKAARAAIAKATGSAA